MSSTKKSPKDVFGFQQSYNQNFYRWLAIPFGLFCLSQLPQIRVTDSFCNPSSISIPHAPAGACYYYLNFPRLNIALTIHLLSVLPAGLLAILQFTPAIRSRYRRFHRIGGYAATILGFTGILSALFLMDKSFGGDVSVLSSNAALGLACAFTLYKGIMEARAKRFASHRDWMLRAWMYMGSVLTLRLLMPGMAVTVSTIPAFRQHIAIPCEVVLNIFKDDAAAAFAEFPVCSPENALLNPTGQAMVLANVLASSEVQQVAALRAIFGSCEWMALAIHAAGVEWYLKWSKARETLAVKEAEKRVVGKSVAAERTAQAFSSAVGGHVQGHLSQVAALSS